MTGPKKPWPTLRTDEEAEDFVANADLTEYDLSVGEPISYVFADVSLSVPMSRFLLREVTKRAKAEGIDASQYVYDIIERHIFPP